MLGLAAIHLIAMVLCPLFLLNTQNLYWLILLLPSLLLTNTTWALIHEGIHSNLNSNPKKNLIYSRFLARLLHANFETLKFGHLQHHRYNRTDYDLTDGYDGGLKNKLTKLNYFRYKISRSFFYYLHISIGLLS